MCEWPPYSSKKNMHTGPRSALLFESDNNDHCKTEQHEPRALLGRNGSGLLNAAPHDEKHCHEPKRNHTEAPQSRLKLWTLRKHLGQSFCQLCDANVKYFRGRLTNVTKG